MWLSLMTAANVANRPAKYLISLSGGGSGIRTHDTVSRIHAFQACALSHSAIPPKLMRSRNIALHARVTNLLYGRGRVCIGTNKNAQLTQRTLPASLTS